MTEDLLTTEITEEEKNEDDAELYSVVAGGQRPSLTRRTAVGVPAELETEPDTGEEAPFHQIEFVHDVPLRLSVEIGQTTLSVREILGLNVGRSIEFTKVVGEPMDITVSGRLMARGEIVVVNERYGVRISEVTRPDETGSYSTSES